MNTIHRYYLVLCLVIVCLQNAYANNYIATDRLLEKLDSVIINRDQYLDAKLAKLNALHQELTGIADNDREKFEILGRLYSDYHSFNADSAYVMAQRQLAIANRLNDKGLIFNAILNKANIMCNVGMYHEALGLIDSIDVCELPDYLRAYYFHAKRTLYGNLADYAKFKPEKDYYEKITDTYRDSLLTVNDPESVFYALIKADQLNVHNSPQEAINMLETYIREHDLSDHEMAICAYTLSEAYSNANDTENQKRMLLISAISDMKSAVREYVSLRQLALLLYQEGDLERAYSFMTIAVDDAAKSNSRQRIIELNDSYPMINKIYIETVNSQKKTLEHTILIITVLSVILIVLLFYMRKQMLKIADGRKKVEEANNKLSELNSQLSESNGKLNVLNAELSESNEKLNTLNAELSESNGKLNVLNAELFESNEKLNTLNNKLTQSNAKLQDAYKDIAEISELKEVYICQYMDQSLEHIEMLDSYRKAIAKLVSAAKMEDLKKLVKSSKIIEDELRAFYDQFDKTFLNLFPTFVDDFNSLLLPQEAIVPKKAGTMNTELRIYALIRLGITDSDKIAKFLRYSLTTIYNYRTKVRNKAKGDRNKLESEVAKIGQHSSEN